MFYTGSTFQVLEARSVASVRVGYVSLAVPPSSSLDQAPPDVPRWIGAIDPTTGGDKLHAMELQPHRLAEDTALLQHLDAILQAAQKLGIVPPAPFLFRAGQAFYAEDVPVEVRMQGFVDVTELPQSEGDQPLFRGTPWSVGGPLLFSTHADGLRLSDEVRGLWHRSVAVEVRGSALFLLAAWNLVDPPSSSDQLNLPFLPFTVAARVGKAARRLRSVMSQVPVPRRAAQSAASLSLIRGLGRMFSGYSEIPHLGLQDAVPTQEAQRIFWGHLTAMLDEDLRQRTPAASWQIVREQHTDILLIGVPESEARTLWCRLSRSLNKGEGGPGIQVAEPDTSSASHWDAVRQTTVVASRWRLWPERALRDKSGWESHPVQFRNEGSPGYLELLERHGSKPFFAQGWLWIPRGAERDGFRIGGLATLLFPEGRAALEHIKKREIQSYEDELNRIFQNPELYPQQSSTDASVARDLRAAIHRVQRWVATLTVFDVQDVILCIFEAFHRQRDAWAREQLQLPDGRIIETRPWRLLYLDPEDMRIRLDPAQCWGDNWRSRIFEKLEALTTFSRQTRTRAGRKVDVGDRLLNRILDGLRTPEEQGNESDPTLALAHLLHSYQAFPINAFLVEVSLEFMQRLVTFATSPEGAVRWGLGAPEMIKEQAERQGKSPRQARDMARSTEEEARSKPTFDHSPRLMTLGNLEHWSIERKQLAYVLLQEVTPCQQNPASSAGSRYQVELLEGQRVICCNGSRGHGYQVQTWMQKVGYDRTSSKRGPGRYAAFIEDLESLHRTLGLRMQVKDSHLSTAAVLRLLARTPSTSRLLSRTILRLYLPVDLEERLRRRLAAEGIDAIDAAEEQERQASPVLQRSLPARPLTPDEIHLARLQLNLTQNQLAERVGVTKMMISLWESGRKPVAAERMEQLRQILAQALSPSPAAVEDLPAVVTPSPASSVAPRKPPAGGRRRK
jgi:DNA-binding transcriptional regulator YiaG